MAERFHGFGSAAVGTNKAILNLFAVPVTPTKRARIYDLIIGCAATPADAASNWQINRTTGVGTEDGGFAPVNIDPDGPGADHDFGVGHSGGEPTKTANAVLFQASVNQRATFRHVCDVGAEFMLPATQNNGACLQTTASTVATAHECAIWFME